MEDLRGKATMAAGKRVTQCLIASMMVAGILVFTSQAASAAQSADRSVTCSFAGTVHFSPPLGTNRGGTHASRVSATLSGCTYNSGIVEAIYSARLTGKFASSPFTCSLSPTNAPLSAVITWNAKAWPQGGIARTRINDGSATGSFAGTAVVNLAVPSTLAGGCAGGRMSSASVSGTISIGQACGGVYGPVTLYPIARPICGAQAYMPTSITTGPDGALWFPTYDANLIGRMTTAGVTTFFPAPLGGQGTWGNGGITAGSDGALWFLANSGAAIGRMTTSGATSTFPIPAGSGFPTAITSGPDGALWFTLVNNKGANAIGQLTTSGQMTIYTDPSLGTGDWSTSAHRYLWDITSGPDGALWLSGAYASNVVGPGSTSIWRISTSGAVTDYPIPFDAAPTVLTAGPDGAIWFGTNGDGMIGRVTTSGVFSEFGNSSGDVGQVLGITAGPDGAVWFTNYTVPGDTGYQPLPPVVRISTNGTLTTYKDPGVEGAMAITTGPDGAVWFNDHLNDAIGRVSVP